MNNTKTIVRHIALSTVVTLAAASVALAAPQTKHKKQVSYEDAWTICKKFVDEGVKSWDQTAQRYSRGASCMKKYGYRI